MTQEFRDQFERAVYGDAPVNLEIAEILIRPVAGVALPFLGVAAGFFWQSATCVPGSPACAGVVGLGLGVAAGALLPLTLSAALFLAARRWRRALSLEAAGRRL